MITLSKFEQLVMTNIPQKPMELAIGQNGERIGDWILTLSGTNKHGQCTQLQSLLGDLLMAEMDDKARLDVMAKLMPTVERVIGQLRNDYIYEHQNLLAHQQQSVGEVRSLYFLMVLIYKSVASRAYLDLHQSDNPDSPYHASLLKKLVKTLNFDAKQLVMVAIYQMTSLYVKLLLEYALTYQRSPRVIWQQLNFWYLRAVHEGVSYQNLHKSDKNLPHDSIHHQYEQACLSNFANFFAYRRQDILSVFKVLPTWVRYIESTFEPRPELRVFVNLLGNHPPEVITPYATVNPYSEEYQCLFFDVARLIAYLQDVKAGKYITADAHSVFEVRLAKMVLIAFDRNAKQDRIDRVGQQKAELLTGFAAIFDELAGGKLLSDVINREALMETYQPKAVQPPLGVPLDKEMVVVTNRSETLARFNYSRKTPIHDDIRDIPMEHTFLQVFGLFALKSASSKHKNPWKLGIAHWVDRFGEQIEVDGRFLGRILLAAGVRLLSNDSRSQEYVHALLIDGDELNQQSTLVVPRSHFKAGDLVLMRIDNREMELRLERSLLSTDEMEQYQIVRLNG